MGAYENPNINVGVDNQSGQLIGQAIANFGQGIAKGIDASSKIMAEATARERQNKKENREREARNGMKLVKDIAGVAAKQTTLTGNIGQSASMMATQGFMGANGQFVPPVTESLNRISAGKGDTNDYKVLAQWETYTQTAGKNAGDMTAFWTQVGDLDQSRVANKYSSADFMDMGNGNITNLETIPSYNKDTGFSTKQIATLRDGRKFEYSVDGTAQELQASINDENSNHYGTGTNAVITVPEFGNQAKIRLTDVGIMKKGGTGVKGIMPGFLNPPLTKNSEDKVGYFTTTSIVPNLEAIDSAAQEDATATAETEVGIIYGVTTANAWINDYMGEGGKVEIPNAKGYRDEAGNIINSGGSETITMPEDGNFLKPITDPNHPQEDIYTSRNGVLLSKKAMSDYAKVLAFSNVTTLGAYQNGPEEFEGAQKYTSKKSTSGPTRAEYVNSNLNYLKGLNTDIKDKNDNVIGKKYESNIKDKVYNDNEGGAGLIKAIKNDPRYKGFENVIDYNYLPLVSGGKYEKRAEKQTNRAQAEVVFAELGLPKGTTLESLKETGAVAEGVAFTKKDIEKKIKAKVDARMLVYKKNLDKGLIFNLRPSTSAPEQILTSAQFIRQLPNRLSAVTPKGAN